MYTPWLKPVDKPSPSLPAHSLGKKLRPRSRRIAVAIIGLDDTIAEKTRHHLYGSSWGFGKLSVRDLGNIRKTTPDFIIPLLRELHSAEITPILIGGDQQLFRAQFLAFGELTRQVSVLTVDRQVRLSADGEEQQVLDPAVHRKDKKQFHLTHLGAQQHLVDPAIWDLFASRNFEAVRLGQAKADLSHVEPLIRDADLMGLDIASINHAEAPARPGYHPSGFGLQEATQLAYYAGNSDKLSSFGLYGFQPDTDREAETELTAAAYAQLIWYFLQGYSRRYGDFPVSTKGLLEYVVDLDGFDRLTFWRSSRSNRWWVQIPAGRYKGEERHRLLPCTYNDYLTASNEQNLPDRLVTAFQRYG
ncbi:hypothetical protein SAMN05444359_11655 [Neolewinella agarilytica]|uniref:Arginase family enzyme n=1 Tax=Neolewinella agarilytica TaxID=478744 RepID=A0A1H9J238_9BACT|nr:hypothetical protein SAMN05444359_11655 [Neolewinella agarilytica]